MKKPERIVGFIKYEDIDFPFEFEEESFTIRIYAPTKDVWERISKPSYIFRDVGRYNKKHEWISQKEIKGITSENYNIIFNVQDISSNYHGFISYNVNWYYIYSDELEGENIGGFRISGKEIDYFYPPQIALQSEVSFNKISNNFEKITLSSTNINTESCGKYRIIKNVDAEMELLVFASLNYKNDITTLNSSSYMKTEFSSPVSLDVLLDAYYNISRFFNFLTYRKNIDIGDLEVFYINDSGLKDFAGLLVFPKILNPEKHKDVNKKIIKYNQLKKNSTKIFRIINKDILGFQHLCESIDDRHHYPASRIIMIFAQLEREFRNIYGQESNRSYEYREVKKDIITIVETYLSSKTGIHRKYAKQLKKYLENRDNSFEDNIRKALFDCEEIITTFVINKYEGSFSENVNDISMRMGVIRNGIAHRHFDLKFDAIHLTDIKIIEQLIYAMRLKNIAISNSDIEIAIRELF